MITKITCLADAINHVPRVRVIKENDPNYGKEFDIAWHDYIHKSITISCSSLAEYDYSEIQFLTPVQYEWRYVGLGDKVNWCEVFDYRWYDDGWNYSYSTYGDYNNIQLGNENDVHTFTPLHQLTPKIELSTEEMVEELKRRWVVTSGNIINS